jgi:hypothetical protein
MNPMNQRYMDIANEARRIQEKKAASMNVPDMLKGSGKHWRQRSAEAAFEGEQKRRTSAEWRWICKNEKPPTLEDFQPTSDVRPPDGEKR